MKNNHINWNSLLQFSVLVLGLSPKDFWGLTMPELIAVMQNSISNGITRADLENLIKMHKSTVDK